MRREPANGIQHYTSTTAITDQAHRAIAYPPTGKARTRNGGDGSFRDYGRSLTLTLYAATAGYDARLRLDSSLHS